ncbi:response regulator [Pricia sp. S334]|uniref:Response regulator n=1 Tax=Pricia mediterranea TaxID=3076079 RepID=A0ABU3L2L5_9FLAO|nr:response regulator [Pricia sp. S334]MDT7827984.1 response regulator [Pricia sp. S334]
MIYDLIYLVDDLDMVNHLHRILLKRFGAEERVKVFTDPKRALGDLRTRSGEDLRILILLDINMPEMSGFEFLDRMVAGFFPYNIDVVVVTSSLSGSDRALANRYPRYVRDFVVKPLQMEKLGDILSGDSGSDRTFPESGFG